MGMPGGWGDAKSPTEEEVAVLMGLKGDIETALGKTCDIFEAIAYVTQVQFSHLICMFTSYICRLTHLIIHICLN